MFSLSKPVVALAVTAALTGGLAIGPLATGASAAVSPTVREVARDAMNRHVAHGFGRANVGGLYRISPRMDAHVSGSEAHLGPIAHGHSVSAELPQVHAHDLEVSAMLRPSRVKALGGGFYMEVALRRTAAATYYAKARVMAGGAIRLSFSRVRDGVETVLGTGLPVAGLTKQHRWLHVLANVTGSTTVRLRAKLWATGRAKPRSWQVSTTDSSDQRIDGSGSIGITGYLSASAGAPASVAISSFAGWNVTATHKPSSPTPPVTTPPVTTPPVTTPPQQTGSAGAAAPGTTDYPVPAGATIVATTGNDSAVGTVAAPLRTLAHALSVTPTGGTIVLRAGVYHESVTAFKAVTVQPWPGEAVWLDGSTAVTGWTQSGNDWIHSGWTATDFNTFPSYTSTVSTQPGWGFVNPAYPLAACPDQVWVNGSALTQVASAAAVEPGDFYIDRSQGQIVLGSDPTQDSVSASDLQVAFTSYAQNLTLRGIGVRRYATSVNQIGAVRLPAANDTLENVTVMDGATTGISIGNSGDTISHVTVTRNGLLGLTAVYADGLKIDGLLSTDNNTQSFNFAPVSGGTKITRTRGVHVTNSVFEHNNGYGLWFDESCYDIEATHDTSIDNAWNGVAVEISSTAVLADDVVKNNGGDGMKINDTDNVQIWNNDIEDNGNRGIAVVQDSRRGSNLSDPGHNPHRAQPDATEPWIISNVTIGDNVLSNSPAGQVVATDNTGGSTPLGS